MLVCGKITTTPSPFHQPGDPVRPSVFAVLVACACTTKMCRSCCTHAQLYEWPPCTREEPTSHLYHIGLFTMQHHGICFPGEQVILDVFVASALRLLSEVQTTGLRPQYHDTPSTWQPAPTHLVNKAFGIAPNNRSPVGVLVVFDTRLSRVSSTSHFTHFSRFRARVIGRYALAAPVHMHAPYPCAQVRLLCDIPHPRLLAPLHEAFPCTSPAPEARKPAARRVVLTRAAAAAVRDKQRHRSSAFMAGLDYVHWQACMPQRLVRRARAAAMYARLELDRCLLEDSPEEDDCPSVWSFWLCAALPDDTPAEVLLDLLKDTSVIVRLRKLIELFDSLPRKSRKRPRTQTAADKPYRCKSSPKKVRRQGKITEGHDSPSLKTPPPTSKRRIPSCSALVDELKNRPWPSSPARGFQRVDLSTPVKGRFKRFLPSTYDTPEGGQTAVKPISPASD